MLSPFCLLEHHVLTGTAAQPGRRPLEPLLGSGVDARLQAEVRLPGELGARQARGEEGTQAQVPW